MTWGLLGEAEKGEGRTAPRIWPTATGKNEKENVGREPDLRWDGRKNSFRKLIYFRF